MSRRGSAQLLLLFFRSRSLLGWTMGVIASVLLVASLIHAGHDFPLLTRTGLAQMLRQSAWNHALAGLPEQAAWPWDGTPAAASPRVPRLGLSASIVTQKAASEQEEGAAEDRPKSASADDAPRTGLSEVGIGDRITVTSADGSSHVYRVTGRRVVDPHLADTESGPLDGDATLVTCLPLDPLLASSLRLVIQATKVDPPAPVHPGPEQKL